MLCENCQTRPANLHITSMVNNQRRDMNLCHICAVELGLVPEGQLPGQNMGQFFNPAQRKQNLLQEAMSDAANRVLSIAKEEAKRLGHPYIDTEHLLLALIKEQGLAAKLLTDLKVDLVKLFSEIENKVGRGQPSSDQGSKNEKRITLTPRAKQVLEQAHQTALQSGSEFIGPEHILLGLLREGEGIAYQVLNREGITFEKVAEKILSDLGQKNKKAEDFFTGQPIGDKKSALAQYGRDLTELARLGKLDPVVGREREIDRVVRILSRRTKNNPVLIGDPGVGKTAIAEGLAQEIVSGNIPEILKGRRVIELDLNSMISGTRFRGDFEERIKKVMQEIKKSRGNIILFIDELHNLVGAGSAEGSADAANILKPALARGELQCLGATTMDEYRKYIEKDSALERRFHPVKVDEPTVEETIEILKGLRDKYEAHHRVAISDEVLAACAKMADRYINDRFLPDKAIDLMDETAAKIRIRSVSPPVELKKIQKQIERAKKELQASATPDVKEKLKIDLQKWEEEEKKLSNDWQFKRGTKTPRVTVEDISETVADSTGIPVTKIEQEESSKLVNLEEILGQKVVGQKEAIRVVAEAVRRSRSGIADPNRPTASLLFVGPTGVGKTELAKNLAEFLFGSSQKMIRFDMTEYVEKHTVSKLIGSPPGYVGYDEGGQLTEQVRRNPYSVILLDEIEKAHPEIFNILLQVMDDGHLTDSQGRRVDFRNVILILTSNVGTGHTQKTGIGFDAREVAQAQIQKERVEKELKDYFRPEFLNRLDEMVVFQPLTKTELKQIVSLLFEKIKKRLLAEKNITLELSESAQEFLLSEGTHLSYGARPLRRALQKHIENPLATLLLKGEFKEQDQIRIDVAGQKIEFVKK